MNEDITKKLMADEKLDFLLVEIQELKTIVTGIHTRMVTLEERIIEFFSDGVSILSHDVIEVREAQQLLKKRHCRGAEGDLIAVNF